ncbi:MAG TPA: hypothetical protein P5205_14810 [Candidatus Paceibacterota bacterium]|nr:hypothetical protein [Verrucomicrobiota bacterium]HSA11632.1 hypothetical protein [Candidatus Paceibacterota bacterium]
MDLPQILLVLLVLNVVADVACRRGASEPWAKPLCLGAIVDLTQHKVDGLAGIVVLPGTLLAGALLWFVYLYRSRLSRRPPPR